MDPSRKTLVQMSGAPGSGKSTTAHLLVKSLNGVVVNHDLIRSFFLDSDISPSQSAKLTYRFQWVLAEDMIKQGRSVIMDSTCNFKETLDDGMSLAQRYGYVYKYVECRINDIDLLDQRLRSREPMRSQRTGVELPPSDVTEDDQDQHAIFKNWIENPCRPVGDLIVVDSTQSPEDSLHYIMGRLAPPTGVRPS